MSFGSALPTQQYINKRENYEPAVMSNWIYLTKNLARPADHTYLRSTKSTRSISLTGRGSDLRFIEPGAQRDREGSRHPPVGGTDPVNLVRVVVARFAIPLNPSVRNDLAGGETGCGPLSGLAAQKTSKPPREKTRTSRGAKVHMTSVGIQEV